MYLRNCWYVAAWGSEIGETPLARTMLDEPIVLYRKADGGIVALEDRCCHRNLPLAMGKVLGDDIRCGYHGVTFGPNGKVVSVPGQTTLPPGAMVKSYPVIEKWRWVWVWMGDPAKADASMIPNYYHMEHPDWVVAPGNAGKPLYIKCNYELNNDNLLDLTHVQFTHATSLGGSPVGDFPVKTERSERGVRLKRFLYNVAPTPMFAKHVDAKTVDRWMIADLEAPTHYILDAGIVPPGRGEPGHNRQGGIDFRAIISGTPETSSTMYMFYAQVRNFAHRDAALTDAWVDSFRQVFLEDVAVMEAQQRVIDKHPDAPTIDINSDTPTIAMRKVLAQLIAEEQAAAHAA